MVTAKKWYVYVAVCADGSFYTGITVDLKRRERQHNTGKGSRSILGRLPLKIVYSRIYETRSEASSREWEIKQFSHHKKKQMIEEMGP